MSREHILMVLGALVLLSPWSGIPMEWLQWALLLIGIAIIGISFTMRKRESREVSVPPPSDEPRPRSSSIAFS